MDGRDAFKVTKATVLCEKYFAHDDIKLNPSHWRLVAGTLPSRNLFTSSITARKHKSRKPPASRMNQAAVAPKHLVQSITSSAYDSSLLFPDFYEEERSIPGSISVSISTQTDFSFIDSPVYLPSDSADVDDEIMKFFLESNSMKLKTKELDNYISYLSDQVVELELHLTKLKKSIRSIEKLRNDDSATRFYTGFPNASSLLAKFEYFEHYWRGK